ncbi:MAG: DUF4157 domain-containing protein [Pseudomonadota bacterium]
MAQIFASDRGTQGPSPAATTRPQVRDTAPERALAGVQAQADHSHATAKLTQFQLKGRAPLQRQPEEEELQMKPLQRMEDEEMLQGMAVGDTLQRMGDEDELMQGKASGRTLQRQDGARAAPANGGLPDPLRHGIEQLSGTDVSGVNVHYNSSAPAKVGAHAFAQGTDIHLAAGQEKHLPHEAWHVVQQRQGRVAATMDLAGTPVNDDPALEAEADVMGAKASQLVSKDGEL